MVRAVVFFVLMASFFGCTKDRELRFDENSELIVAGQITTATDIDLSSVPISIIATKSSSLFGGISDFAIIGTGFSDAEGNYSIITSFPENASDIRLEVNDWRNGNPVDSISRISLDGVDNLSLKNSKYAIPQLHLKRIKLFEIEVKKNSNTLDTLGFSITSTSAIQMPSIDREGNLNDHDTRGGSSSRIDPDDIPRTYTLEIIENSEILIQYSIRNNGLLEQGEFIIPTDGGKNRFVFEY